MTHDAREPLLRCEGLAKRFGSTVAVNGFDLDVERGTLTALLGPSGCGKTTALRLICGLERPDEGQVRLSGRRVAGGGDWVPPERRRIGLVFQDGALFPHLDVHGNVRFGLQGLSSNPADERVRELLELVRMDGLGRRMPHELSGGQQQRVALARALAPAPDVILLDEPFSNLDARLRAEVRADVRRVLRAAGATALFVTHDQEEALSIADRVGVMANGRVLQVGSPYEVYAEPRSRLVAELVGRSNLVAGWVADGRVVTPLGHLPAPGRPDGPIEGLIRPEAVELIADPDGEGRVTRVEFYGHDQMAYAEFADHTVIEVRLVGPHPEVAEGSRVRVDLTGAVHWFEPESQSPGGSAPECHSFLPNPNIASTCGSG